MGRLGNIRPAISTLPQRVKTSFEVRDQAQGLTQTPWRAWYKTKRWQDLRLAVFARDLYRCQRTGEMCIGKHPSPNSPVANHKTPHRGRAELFWSMDNIETVTKAVHDSIIQSEERRSGH